MTNSTATLIELFFFSNIFLILLCYFGYPVFVLIVSLVKNNEKNDRVKVAKNSHFSIVFSIYNSAQILNDKLDNLLQNLTPFQNASIYVMSDGSTDGTNQILKDYSEIHPNFHVLYGKKNIGKNQCLNQILEKVESDIVVFTDGDSLYDNATFEMLLGCFSNKEIGAVIGNLSYTQDNHNAAVTDKDYWNAEKSLKQIEGKSGLLFAGNGALFAARKSLISELLPGIPNDLQTPIEVLDKGYKVVYCKEARVYEKLTSSRKSEISRRIRTINRGMNAVYRLKGKLRKQIWWLLFFRKVPRWAAAVLYPTLFILNLFLLGNIYFNTFFILQIIFYLIGILGLTRSLHGIASLPSYFLIVNMSTLAAFYRLVSGKSYITWNN